MNNNQLTYAQYKLLYTNSHWYLKYLGSIKVNSNPLKLASLDNIRKGDDLCSLQLMSIQQLT